MNPKEVSMDVCLAIILGDVVMVIASIDSFRGLKKLHDDK